MGAIEEILQKLLTALKCNSFPAEYFINIPWTATFSEMCSTPRCSALQTSENLAPGLSLEGAECLHVSLRHWVLRCSAPPRLWPLAVSQSENPSWSWTCNGLCLEAAFACKGDVFSAPAPGSKLITLLMFLGIASSPWSSCWLSGRETHLVESLNAPTSGFEKETLGRICWHTND